MKHSAVKRRIVFLFVFFALLIAGLRHVAIRTSPLAPVPVTVTEVEEKRIAPLRRAQAALIVAEAQVKDAAARKSYAEAQLHECFFRIEGKNQKRINKVASIQHRDFALLRIASDPFRRFATAIWLAQSKTQRTQAVNELASGTNFAALNITWRNWR